MVSNYHSPIDRELYTNNSTIWLPANQGFGVYAWLTSPRLYSATWTRKSTSYPFTWNTSPTNMNSNIEALSFSGSSGSTAYNQRNGIFTLSALTECGNYSADYTWPIIVQGWSSFSMSVSPNPVVDNATLSITEESPEVKALSADQDVDIYLVDDTSGLIVKKWKFKNNQRQFRLNFNGVRHGTYLLKATIGKYESAKQVIVGGRN